MNEGISGRARHRPFSNLRGVMLAVPAAVALALSSAGLAAPAQAAANPAVLRPARVAPESAAARALRLRLAVWRFALRQRGKPYIWGGTGPAGFDCSGLVYAAYRAAGVNLPRTTYEMLASWRLVRISKSEARRGDLAFFGTGHVELYDWGRWTFGAADSGSRIGFHAMNVYWQPTMYFRVRV